MLKTSDKRRITCKPNKYQNPIIIISKIHERTYSYKHLKSKKPPLLMEPQLNNLVFHPHKIEIF